jgi:hypothetical protein
VAVAIIELLDLLQAAEVVETLAAQEHWELKDISQEAAVVVAPQVVLGLVLLAELHLLLEAEVEEVFLQMAQTAQAQQAV